MGDTLSAEKAASSADPRPRLAGFNPNISAEMVVHRGFARLLGQSSFLYEREGRRKS